MPPAHKALEVDFGLEHTALERCLQGKHIQMERDLDTEDDAQVQNSWLYFGWGVSSASDSSVSYLSRTEY
jgi:hypothetical protein